MKLRSRLFLAFFLFAFVPVAIASYVSLELALDSLDRLTSPGIRNAFYDADSLVNLSIANIESDCMAAIESLDIESSAEAYAESGFDAIIIVTDTDTNFAVMPGEWDSMRSNSLIELVSQNDSAGTSGRMVIGDDLLVYGIRASGGTVVIGGYVLTGGYGVLYRDFNANIHRFHQVELLTTSGRDFMRIIWAAAIIAYLLVIMLVTRVTARGFTRPMSKLGELVDKVGPGNWDVRLKYDRRDEVGSLVTGFNRMSSRLSETTRKLIEAEKIAAWQQTARVIAHGIKNTLAPVKLAIARLTKNVDSSDVEVISPLSTIQLELEVLEQTAADFSTYGRPIESKPTEIDVNMLVRQASRLYEADSEGAQIRLELEEDVPRITADENAIRQALINLVKNACEAAGEDGVVTLKTSAAAGGVAISVSDTGSGIAPEVKDRLFEPYVTTKPTGTGLGLPIVEKVISSNGGTIDLETGSDGTTFRILFGSERDAERD
jgi:nitrogen fixation/metabolism regulation signal transduction histidine kinase